MRLIYEESQGDDFKPWDFLEIILTQRELSQLDLTPAVAEFTDGLQMGRPLNIMVRMEEWQLEA